MRNFGFFLFCLLFISCEYFGFKESNKEDIIEREMKSINWNDVDKYPLFDNCDETASKTVQKECFQITLTKYVLNSLSQNSIEVRENMNDTVYVHLLISNEGLVSILKIEKSDKVTEQIPQLNRYIATSIQSLPTIHPALKRNIPVSTKFKIPIVLKVN